MSFFRENINIIHSTTCSFVYGLFRFSEITGWSTTVLLIIKCDKIKTFKNSVHIQTVFSDHLHTSLDILSLVACLGGVKFPLW